MRSSFRSLVVSAVLAAVASVGCAAPAKFVWFTDIPETKVQREPVVEPGDRIGVVVLDHPELSGEHLVGADGTFIQPLSGPAPVAGRTFADAAREIAQRLRPYLQSPSVAVTLVQPGTIRVSVVGEVRAPGTFEVRRDDTVLSVLATAGGLSEFADADSIYVVRRQDEYPRVRFRSSDLERPDPRAVSFRLKDGDTLVVE